uniref:HTH OST-type domain-containing protein n=1 Tax=Anopheles marajoara TaxID=58244 RepID=A0A2M4BNJ8_9DIPT
METLKSQIRGVLISNPKLMTVQNLIADFKLLEGEDIPYKQFGFRTLEDLLRTMPDVLQVHGYGRQATIQPVLTQKSQHMRQLVENSKSLGNWNKQNVPARRPPVIWDYQVADHRSNGEPNDFGMSNTAAQSSGEPKKNNLYHNPVTEKTAMRMIEIVAKNVDRLSSESPPDHVHNDGDPNATKSSKPEITEKKDEAKDAGSKQLPTCFPNATASIQNDSTEQIEENDLETFEPLPAFVKIGSLVPAVSVSPASNLHDIRVQLQQNAAKLHTMSLQMQACRENNTGGGKKIVPPNKHRDYRIGKYCAVRDNEDWFRGMIMSRPENGSVKVYFIDSGAVNLVSVSNVLHLPKKYRFPRQLVRVTMGDIKPIGDRWSEGALRYINQALAHKRMHMFIRAVDEKTNTLDAVLIDTSGPEDVILSRELVRRREAVWTC